VHLLKTRQKCGVLKRRKIQYGGNSGDLLALAALFGRSLGFQIGQLSNLLSMDESRRVVGRRSTGIALMCGRAKRAASRGRAFFVQGECFWATRRGSLVAVAST
jgi:hypothetical protein